ncbi:MAG: hypothetical protein KGR98_12390 [Verrucomicrobia bacterium]|nr:hypothetical protein [Verrucomicrobiota bacterium]
MTLPGHNRPFLFRAVVRDVLVLVLAEAVVFALAWCLTARGKAWLLKLFGARQPGNASNRPGATTIGV